MKARIRAAQRRFGETPKSKQRGMRLHGHLGPGSELHVRHLADVIHSFSELELKEVPDEAGPVWIQVARTGSFRGHHAGPFELNEKVFSEIIRNFKEAKQPIPIDFEHASESDPTSGEIPTKGAPAQGWIHDLRIENGNLYGLVEWGELAKQYIRAGQYRYFSPAIRFNSRDRISGEPIGARMTTGALTNLPYLPHMQRLVARDDEVGAVLATYAYSSAETMPVVRAALRLPELATAAECADALGRLRELHEIGGGADVQGVAVRSYITAIRDALHAPLSSTVEDVFQALAEMIGAAMDEACAGDEASDVELDDDVGDGDDDGVAMTSMETDMNEQQRVTELEADVARANASLAEERAARDAAETELKALRAWRQEHETAAEKMAADVKELREWRAAREERDTRDEVEVAFSTYKDSKRLVESDKADMLAMCKAVPDSFRRMYPPVPPDQRHLLRQIVTPRGGPPATTFEAPTERPTVVQLAERLRAQNPKLSEEESYIAAEKQLRQHASR
ncbi:phage protease [Pendulispora brunnea]|uniref:Phage protease n=1 Tax=Pendulispora brunnea TaxID=2905690 RepID=A0ABZ2KGT0_9BACT